MNRYLDIWWNDERWIGVHTSRPFGGVPWITIGFWWFTIGFGDRMINRR